MASSTFLALCQAQLALMAETLHLGRGVVYLAQDWSGTTEPAWMPVLEYPARANTQLLEEAGTGRSRSRGRSRLLSGSGPWAAAPAEITSAIAPKAEVSHQAGDRADVMNLSIAPEAIPPAANQITDADHSASAHSTNSHSANSAHSAADPALNPLFNPQPHPGRLVLPLARGEMMLGLLVLDRSKPWTPKDRQQAGRVAVTLAAACELDRRNQLLEAAYRQQQTTQQRQAELLHNWLHQFRNPLTAIRTFGKLVLKRLGGEDRSRSHLESLLREGDRLQGMLTDFSQVIDTPDWTGAAAPGADQPSPSELPAPAENRAALLLPGVTIAPWPVDTLVMDAIAAAEAVAIERGRSFQISLPAGLPPVLADGTAWREVFSNLLDNAIKYACDRGRVQVLARVAAWQDAPAAGWGLAVVVNNQGNNIPPADLERLFQRGFRGIQAASPIPGTGLGLAIARQLMMQMGGRLELFSPPIALSARLRLRETSDQLLPSIAQGTMAVAWLPLAETNPPPPELTSE
ncbi:sensor histidine kinase [Limnothrix redekei]|uniref:histidine kinase n=1 Tax=Limnothrix redekei LRLZ20PSL1 TaxID=3112953 RepID=A0ABW7C7L6_9CYAN